ncbi:MAG: hypothetical protein EOO28_05700 [Comamonadaceae bacterium]|nr:MAG: hypothetical protein EOO28_05700 [Comamonadaceae bacterium]
MAASANCDRGGYIARIVQGWPLDDNVIGITLKDTNGQLTNWSTNSVMDVNSSAAARSVLAIALTAYASQAFVYVTVDTAGACNQTYREGDAQEWHHGWKGIVIPQGPNKW